MDGRRLILVPALIVLLAVGLSAVTLLYPGISYAGGTALARGLAVFIIASGAVLAVRAVRGDISILTPAQSEWVHDWIGEPEANEPPKPCWRSGRLNASDASRCEGCDASLG